MAKHLKGIDVVRALSETLKTDVARLKEKGIAPCLCVVRAGESPDDIAYEKGIAKRCEATGIEMRHLVLEEDATTSQVVESIEELNADDTVHGVLIMRPLPGGIDDGAVRDALAPEKDMDGITDLSMAAVYAGARDAFAPCTAEACIELLDYYNIELAGKNVVVVGRSLVIGKPVAMMLIKKNATVTVCHTKTVDMEGICKRADIIVAAAGSAGMIGAGHLSPGQVVVDVGININKDGNLVGDVDFDAADAVVEALTPVPGGVGTVTSAILAKHVVQAASERADA